MLNYMKQMLKRVLCGNPNWGKVVFLISMLSFSIPSFAQFYDKDDELRYYLWKDSKYPGNSLVMAFNFNGDKAAMMGSVNSPGTHSKSFNWNQLLEDPDFLVKRIYDTEKIYIVSYSSDKSTSSRTVYKLTEYANNAWGFIDHTYYTYYNFSKSGNSLQVSGSVRPTDEEKVFYRVTLPELLDYISEVVAESEKRKRWR